MVTQYVNGMEKFGRRFAFTGVILSVLLVFPGCKTERAGEQKGVSSQPEPTKNGENPSPDSAAPNAGARPESQVTEAKTQEMIQSWVRAQNAGAFPDYAKLYAARMLGIKRVGTRETSFDRKGWLADRESMFAQAFTVEVSDLKITLGAGTAVVRFQQTWSNPRFRDEGPKQLVISAEAGELRISREEMLASDVGEQKLVGVVPPADLGLVRIAGSEVRLLLAKRPHLSWISGSPRMSPAGAAVRTVEAKLVPEPERGLVGQRFELFDETGARCEATAESLEVLIDVIPHFGTVNVWEGRDVSSPPVSLQERALDMWEMSSERGQFLTLNMKPTAGEGTSAACKKPVWGRVVKPGAEHWAVASASPQETQRLGTLALGETDYRSQFKGSGKAPSPEMIRNVRVFEHKDGRKYAVAHLVAPGERCGQAELLPYWVILRVTGTGANVVSNGDVGNAEAPLGVVDVPGLTEPVFVSPNYTFQKSTADGLFQRSLDQRPENFDCSC